MKILIVTAMSGAWPYIPEMVAELNRAGHHVDVFDMDDTGRPPLPLRLAMRFARLERWARSAAFKHRLACLARDYDAVNIHYVAPVYADLVGALRRHGRRLVASIWGSDYLRANPGDLAALGRTFDGVDIVTSNNPAVAAKMGAWRPGRDDIRIVRFGLGSFDRIEELAATQGVDAARSALGLPKDKIVVACGYNGNPFQNHALMAEGLALVAPARKPDLFALVPMSYGAGPGHVEAVRQAFEKTGVPFRILDTMQSADTVCQMRIACDVALNVQATDSLSASIQEHMLAGSAMVVGEWLPYDVFAQMGVPIRRVRDAADIARALDDARPRSPLRPAHADALYAFSSWRDNIAKWLAIYSTAGRGV